MTEEFEVLKFDSDYEIGIKYPHPIVKISTKKIVSECVDNGYYRVCINLKRVFKHRLIAIQWIENDDPETKDQIDHINRNKLDNRIENLRWISQSENIKNRDKYQKQQCEYISKLPENSIKIDDYNGIELDRYYYDTDSEKLYLQTVTKNVRYKIIKPSLNKNLLTVYLVDVNGKRYGRSYPKMINDLKQIL